MSLFLIEDQQHNEHNIGTENNNSTPNTDTSKRFQCRSSNPTPKRRRGPTASNSILEVLDTIVKNDAKRLAIDEKNAHAAVTQADALNSLAKSMVFLTSTVSFYISNTCLKCE